MTLATQPILATAIAVVALTAAPRAIHSQRSLDPETIVRDWKTVNRHSTVVDSAGRKFVRLDEGKSMGLVWAPLEFTDGEIELDVRGRDVLQKSFLGVAFRIESDTAFDAVYLRPFNFRAADSTRHAHAIEYISQPAYPWERLRSERPGQYEKPVLPEPDPNAWVHLKVVLRGNDVTAFVNGSASPALHVQALSGRTKGGIGLWVGDPSPGDFTNLVVRPAK
jgi:3-keto-disaccharide hydrolase